ncbi:MAG: hypothetical protein ABW321_17685 [Polyangiales bacterium]
MTLRPWLRSLLVGVALGGLGAVASHASSQDKDKPKKAGGCVDVTTDASFASVGYDHIVTLKSACPKPMTCSVRTNVNPEATSVHLEPGASESVVTWRGSPSRVFTPDVTCSPTR